MKQAQRYAELALHHRDAGNTIEAIRAGLRTIELAPNVAGSYVNLALLYRDADDLDASTKMLFRALALEPENPAAHLALGENLLMRGDFKPGWLEYEWRNRLSVAPTVFQSAQWNGMKLPAGGKLVVIADQGYGDTIQFARFLPDLRPFCDEVIFCCEARLASVFGPSLLMHIQVVTEWEQVPPHAAHVRLSSVPGLLHVNHNTIAQPHATPYIFADHQLAAAWAGILDAGLPAGPLRVGLAWAGRRSHPDDRWRSIPLAQLTPLIDAKHHQLVSLQVELRDADFESIAEFGTPFLSAIDSELTDFAETAAVIENLNLVISVDTAVAHLAGAMGIPTWLLLPTPCDWRWQRGRPDTPWYPSIRLFRQQTLGAWEPVIAQVADELREYFT